MNAKSTENNIINVINNLPIELIELIKQFIPKTILVFTNKTNYYLYHKLLQTYIKNYESYIRETIRRDNLFVFEVLTKENIKKWIFKKNYNYKNIVFNNYLSFIIYYCSENNSDKCKNFILSFLKEEGLSKNQHKKNVVKHIRWTN
jgi:hypothetical protein